MAQAAEARLRASGAPLPPAPLASAQPLQPGPRAFTVVARTPSGGGDQGPHALPEQLQLLRRPPRTDNAGPHLGSFAGGGGSVSLLSVASLDGGLTPATGVPPAATSGERASVGGDGGGLTWLLSLAGGAIAMAGAPGLARVAHLAHPLEVHLLWQPPPGDDGCGGLAALRPPELRLRVISQDGWGLQRAAGEATLPLPLAAGSRDHCLPALRARASLAERERDFFLGGSAAQYAVAAPQASPPPAGATLGRLGEATEATGELALRSHTLLVRAPPAHRAAAAAPPPLPTAGEAAATATAVAAARAAAVQAVITESRALAQRLRGGGDGAEEASSAELGLNWA